jgi:anti-sigma factor RsiW
MLIRGVENLPAAQKKRLLRHLHACETCRLRAERLERLSEQIEVARHTTVPESARQNLWKDIQPGLKKMEPPHPVRLREHKHRIRLAWAVPSLAALTLLVWFSVNRFTSGQPDVHTVPMAESDVAIESATIDGREAVISIFKTNNPRMTFIWLDN